MELLKLNFQQICAATGESRDVIFDAIRAGHIDTFIVARRRFARPEAVRAWVDFLESRSKAGTPVAYRASCPSMTPFKPRIGTLSKPSLQHLVQRGSQSTAPKRTKTARS